MRLAIMCLSALLSGCTAEFVERRARRAGPVPEVVLDAGGGHLRYSLRGFRLAVASRRKDAIEKMEAFCGGPDRYTIVDEVAREDVSARYVATDLADEDALTKNSRHFQSQTVQHLYFECKK